MLSTGRSITVHHLEHVALMLGFLKKIAWKIQRQV